VAPQGAIGRVPRSVRPRPRHRSVRELRRPRGRVIHASDAPHTARLYRAFTMSATVTATTCAPTLCAVALLEMQSIRIVPAAARATTPVTGNDDAWPFWKLAPVPPAIGMSPPALPYALHATVSIVAPV